MQPVVMLIQPSQARFAGPPAASSDVAAQSHVVRLLPVDAVRTQRTAQLAVDCPEGSTTLQSQSINPYTIRSDVEIKSQLIFSNRCRRRRDRRFYTLKNRLASSERNESFNCSPSMVVRNLIPSTKYALFQRMEIKSMLVNKPVKIRPRSYTLCANLTFTQEAPPLQRDRATRYVS